MNIREETDGPTVLSASLLAGVILLIAAGVCFADSDAEKPAATTQPSEKQLVDARAVLRQFLDPLTPGEKQNVEKLIADLGSNRWKIRQAATEKLSRLDIRALPIIIQAAKSEYSEVASRAKQALKVLQAKADNITSELNPAIDTLAAGGDKKITAMLIELLNHPKHSIRYTAEYGLRRITGENFGYNSYDESDERAKAVKKWRQWWKKNEAGFSFAKVKPESFGILICDDRGKNLIALTLDGKVAWSKKLPQAASAVAGLPNGNVVVGYANGKIVEYDRDFKEVWKKTSLSNIADISGLPNGNVLISNLSHRSIIEVDRAGKTTWEILKFRFPYSAQRLANGNTLITARGQCRLVEISPKGKIVWQKGGFNTVYDSVKLPNGNVLIAEGHAKQITEVDIAGKIVRQCKTTGIVISVCQLPNGTIATRLRREGVILMDRNGKIIRWLTRDKGLTGKVRLVPAAVLQKQSAVSSQPSAVSRQQSAKAKK